MAEAKRCGSPWEVSATNAEIQVPPFLSERSNQSLVRSRRGIAARSLGQSQDSIHNGCPKGTKNGKFTIVCDIRFRDVNEADR